MFADFFHIFFPRNCNHCQTPLYRHEELLCLSCKLSLPKVRQNDVDQSMFHSKFYGEIHFRSIFAYLKFYKHGITQELLHNLKYKNQPRVGYVLGRWMGDEMIKQNKHKDLHLIVPVPLHKKKEAERGYNQSTSVAQGISKATGIPYSTRVLSRVVMNESQTNKSRIERWKNVEGIFDVRKPGLIRGKHVLLVDDVITTGATVEACGMELQQKGAGAVSVAALAMAK